MVSASGGNVQPVSEAGATSHFLTKYKPIAPRPSVTPEAETSTGLKQSKGATETQNTTRQNKKRPSSTSEKLAPSERNVRICKDSRQTTGQPVASLDSWNKNKLRGEACNSNLNAALNPSPQEASSIVPTFQGPFVEKFWPVSQGVQGAAPVPPYQYSAYGVVAPRPPLARPQAVTLAARNGFKDLEPEMKHQNPATSSSMNEAATLTNGRAANAALVGKPIANPPQAASTTGELYTVDIPQLEKAYSSSTEAVLLTDDDHMLLWTNSAYNQLVSSEAQCDPSSTATRPVPVSLSQYAFRNNHGQTCRSILWTFLHLPAEMQQQPGTATVPLQRQRTQEERARTWPVVKTKPTCTATDIKPPALTPAPAPTTASTPSAIPLPVSVSTGLRRVFPTPSAVVPVQASPYNTSSGTLASLTQMATCHDSLIPESSACAATSEALLAVTSSGLCNIPGGVEAASKLAAAASQSPIAITRVQPTPSSSAVPTLSTVLAQVLAASCPRASSSLSTTNAQPQTTKVAGPVAPPPNYFSPLAAAQIRSQESIAAHTALSLPAALAAHSSAPSTAPPGLLAGTPAPSSASLSATGLALYSPALANRVPLARSSAPLRPVATRATPVGDLGLTHWQPSCSTAATVPEIVKPQQTFAAAATVPKTLKSRQTFAVAATMPEAVRQQQIFASAATVPEAVRQQQTFTALQEAQNDARLSIAESSVKRQAAKLEVQRETETGKSTIEKAKVEKQSHSAEAKKQKGVTIEENTEGLSDSVVTETEDKMSKASRDAMPCAQLCRVASERTLEASLLLANMRSIV